MLAERADEVTPGEKERLGREAEREHDEPDDADGDAEAAEAIATRLRGQAAGNFRVLGPAFAPLARLRQEHRFQVLLKGRRKAMRDAVKSALVERYGSVRWPGVAVDVDPVTIM